MNWKRGLLPAGVSCFFAAASCKVSPSFFSATRATPSWVTSSAFVFAGLALLDGFGFLPSAGADPPRTSLLLWPTLNRLRP